MRHVAHPPRLEHEHEHEAEREPAEEEPAGTRHGVHQLPHRATGDRGGRAHRDGPRARGRRAHAGQQPLHERPPDAERHDGDEEAAQQVEAEPRGLQPHHVPRAPLGDAVALRARELRVEPPEEHHALAAHVGGGDRGEHGEQQRAGAQLRLHGEQRSADHAGRAPLGIARRADRQRLERRTARASRRRPSRPSGSPTTAPGERSAATIGRESIACGKLTTSRPSVAPSAASGTRVPSGTMRRGR
jgi:hypothetical protein